MSPALVVLVEDGMNHLIHMALAREHIAELHRGVARARGVAEAKSGRRGATARQAFVMVRRRRWRRTADELAP